MDNAGIRSVKDIAEREGVKRSLRAMEEADLVLVILDGSEDLHTSDRDLIKKSNLKNTILVINKIDLPQKLNPTSLQLIKKERGDFHRKIARVSAKKGTGLNKLKDRIVETALNGQTACSTEVVTNIRHVHSLEKAYESLHSFLKGIMDKTPPEFLSVELREALDAVGEILGITTPEDILNRIFSNFCIGK